MRLGYSTARGMDVTEKGLDGMDVSAGVDGSTIVRNAFRRISLPQPRFIPPPTECVGFMQGALVQSCGISGNGLRN